jgi:hypothetical protein
MDYKNGYKVAYEVAANGERAIYASTTTKYPNRDEAGMITDDNLAKFVDADFNGKTVYEDKNGDFFVADTNAAKFDADGNATGVALAELNKKEKTDDGEETDGKETDGDGDDNVDPEANLDDDAE